MHTEPADATDVPQPSCPAPQGKERAPEGNTDTTGHHKREARVPLQNLTSKGPAEFLLGLGFLGCFGSPFLFWDVPSVPGWIWGAHNIQFLRHIAAENEAHLRSHTYLSDL